jgi:hypothetical protein
MVVRTAPLAGRAVTLVACLLLPFNLWFWHAQGLLPLASLQTAGRGENEGDLALSPRAETNSSTMSYSWQRPRSVAQFRKTMRNPGGNHAMTF